MVGIPREIRLLATLMGVLGSDIHPGVGDAKDVVLVQRIRHEENQTFYHQETAYLWIQGWWEEVGPLVGGGRGGFAPDSGTVAFHKPLGDGISIGNFLMVIEKDIVITVQSAASSEVTVKARYWVLPHENTSHDPRMVVEPQGSVEYSLVLSRAELELLGRFQAASMVAGGGVPVEGKQMTNLELLLYSLGEKELIASANGEVGLSGNYWVTDLGRFALALARDTAQFVIEGE